MERISSIYACKVFHGRTRPVTNTFVYSYFMFFLDLDELPKIKGIKLAGYEKRSVYSFRSSDHYLHPSFKTTSGSIRNYFSDHGINGEYRIVMLTNMRTFGYQFNPVSFYFAVIDDKFIGCIAEVGNTFSEQKLYFIPKKNDGEFFLRAPKEFYVSPFSEVDSEFEFKIKASFNDIGIKINTLENGKPVLYSRLEGTFIPLNDRNLLIYTLKFPLVTLKVISMIHWQALRLWLKRTPFARKKDKPGSQRNHYKIS